MIKSATNVLKGDDFVFVYPELLQNKIVVRKGEVITSEILEKNDYKTINSRNKNFADKTRDKIKLRGSIVNEILQEGIYKEIKIHLRLIKILNIN